jgi:hypothetical protein
VTRTAPGGAGVLPKTYTRSYRLLDNSDGALGYYAEQIVNQAKNPHPVIVCRTQERLDDNITLQMLARRLSDQVTVRDNNSARKTQVNADQFIESVELDWVSGSSGGGTDEGITMCTWRMIDGASERMFTLDRDALDNTVATLGF